MTAHAVTGTLVAPSLALLRTQSDERLVVLARDGSEAAFTALVERHRRAVLRACRCILSEARAEDSAQQAFVAAWTAMRRGDEVRDVRAWMLRIARNTALNALRVPGYDHHELQDSMRLTEAPEDELERREVMRRTLAGLAALPERQREALLLSVLEGAPHAAIARDLGLTEGATRQLVRRARNTLRLAASAVTPLPLLRWTIGSPVRGDHVSRVAQLLADGPVESTAALMAKAGVVAALAGGALAGPAVVSQVGGETRDVAPPALVVDDAGQTGRAQVTASDARGGTHEAARDGKVLQRPAREDVAATPLSAGAGESSHHAGAPGHGEIAHRPTEAAVGEELPHSHSSSHDYGASTGLEVDAETFDADFASSADERVVTDVPEPVSEEETVAPEPAEPVAAEHEEEAAVDPGVAADAVEPEV